MTKDVRELVRKLEQQGWRIDTTGRHVKCYPPDRSRQMVVLPSTPSDHRSLRNAVAMLRRSGANL